MLRAYAVAVVMVAGATLARLAVDPALGSRQPFPTYYIAVALTAFFGSAHAALFALALGWVLGQFLFVTHGDPWRIMTSVADVVGSSLYVMVGCVIVKSTEAWRRAQEHAQELLTQLRQREQSLRRQVADLTQLHELGTQLVGSQDLDALLRKVLHAVISLQPADRGSVELYDPAANVLRMRVRVGHEPAGALQIDDVPVAEGEGSCGTAAVRRARVIVEDVETDPLFAPYRLAARAAGFRAVWSTPLLTSHGELVGVMSTHFATPYRPTDEEIQLVELYARVAADTIHSQTLYETLRERETDLRQSDERLRAALYEIENVTSRMSAAVSRCTRDLRYGWASARYTDWLGLPQGGLAGRPIAEVIGTAAFERLRPYFERVLTGERVECEESITFRGIGARWISAVYEPTRDASGAVDGWVGVITDITRRKKLELAVDHARADAEARLRETTALMAASRELSQSLKLEDLLDAICRIARDLLGADGATFVLREGMVVHYAAENAMGPLWKGQRFPIEQCISGWAVLERATAVVGDIMKDPRIPQEAYRPTFVRSLVMSPVRRADPIGAVGVYWAATRTATVEEVRLVEALADVASIAVQNARLFEEVAASNQAKDEFLAMLAHELRNPLAPIRNAVAVLRMIGADDPTTNRARELIDRQVAHMTRLVDDLLDVSRITRGKIALRTEEVALRTIVEEAVEATRPLVDEHGHTLALSLPDPGVRLDADRARLVQVVANLLTNAAKFTPDGGHIAVAAERSASGRAVIRVRDTGIGIGPEMQRRVFDLFAQEDGSVARARGGLGIGLTLVKRLVELHGGHVAVASEGRDRGAEFTVTLPVLVASADAAHPASRDGTGAGAGPLRVMVVEDNPDTAESFGLLLRLSGHDVRVLPRGVDALRLLDEFVADIAFLDIGLPGMDGFELARRLRTDPRVQSMVLVALTGYGRDEDRDEARRAGFDHHMTKPVDIDQLLSLLNTVAPPAAAPRVVH